MLTRVPVLILAVVVVLALCQEPEKPEKRPALLSRYGRAVLPRYGKRAVGGGPIGEPNMPSGDATDEVVCQWVDGKFLCLPVESVRFRPFF